ncbi:hypothetical protein AVEN_232423-1 [Araneus ventricosus]|uniref:Uncharacterized protein n=1 Tax=Araneus ventricosus TaxID=182803 RepID=A0A4Y2S012_ARAVE|nr:hypothetical protein AVEN_232423-1 [Araneus ventricosus]
MVDRTCNRSTYTVYVQQNQVSNPRPNHYTTAASFGEGVDGLGVTFPIWTRFKITRLDLTGRTFVDLGQMKDGTLLSNFHIAPTGGHLTPMDVKGTRPPMHSRPLAELILIPADPKSWLS